MTYKKDIVGIVKEGLDVGFCCHSSWCGYRCSQRKAEYEAMKETLLIAVGALEKIEANSQSDDEGYSEIANDALSRIRSLNP